MSVKMTNLSLLTFLLSLCVGSYADCSFNDQPLRSSPYQKLKPLIGKRYKTITEPYEYHIGICTDASAAVDKTDYVGALQIEIPKKDNSQNTVGKEFNIGKYTSASVLAGTDWVLLEYKNGGKYNQHCTGEDKRTLLFIICDPEATDNTASLTLIDEERDLNSSCYFLFEMSHQAVCAVTATGTSLSIGSIILIVFFSVAGVYLIAGAMYQRFILGAKGVEQLPNYEFWKDFGNLQADGCNFLCRSKDQKSTSPYKGVGDDMIEDAEGRDDNLLPIF